MKNLLLLSAALLLGAGCTTRTVTSAGAAGAVGPPLSVERFLQAANTRDFQGMSRIFGTPDGPIGDTGGTFGCFWRKIGAMFGGSSCQKWNDVELRLDAIAEILQHNDYRIISENRVAGRDQATRIGVDLVVPPNRRAQDIGFVVVRSGERWMIECIELDKVLSGRHNGKCRT